MSVAFSTSANTTAATGSSFSISITVSGSNPALEVGIGINSTTVTVSSVSWSLGSGTAVKIKNGSNSSNAAEVWAIPAPTGGSGNISVTLSGSADYQAAASLFTGADQTTPSSTSDASMTAADSSSTASITITPSNLTSNDCSFGMGEQTIGGNPTGVSPNSRYVGGATNINFMSGDGSGTAALSAVWDTNGIPIVAIGVRVNAASGAAPALLFFIGDLSGIGSPGRFFKDQLQ